MKKKGAFLLPLLVWISFLTSCSNSSQEVGATEVTVVINDEDYTRYAVNSLDAYKIACFAVENNEWIIAAQKWKEGDVLSEQEGKSAALGFTQAMEARLQKGQDAEWNGAPAEEAIGRACSRIRSK
jgi:uncharacterized protein with LGFP repeats